MGENCHPSIWSWKMTVKFLVHICSTYVHIILALTLTLTLTQPLTLIIKRVRSLDPQPLFVLIPIALSNPNCFLGFRASERVRNPRKKLELERTTIIGVRLGLLAGILNNKIYFFGHVAANFLIFCLSIV